MICVTVMSHLRELEPPRGEPLLHETKLFSKGDGFSMAGSVNKVILIGNLGKDPDVKSTQDGMKIVNLAIATSERWKDKNSGEQREKTEWHRVVIFNENLARLAEQYLRKGSTVYIEGQLQTRKWTDQQGAEKYTTEIVLQRYRGEMTFIGGRSDSGQPPADDSMGGGFGGGGVSTGTTPPPMAGSDNIDDDIPF